MCKLVNRQPVSQSCAFLSTSVYAHTFVVVWAGLFLFTFYQRNRIVKVTLTGISIYLIGDKSHEIEIQNKTSTMDVIQDAVNLESLAVYAGKLKSLPGESFPIFDVCHIILCCLAVRYVLFH